jgi:lysophospholipase L1-like esterase
MSCPFRVTLLAVLCAFVLRSGHAAERCPGKQWLGVWSASPADGVGAPLVDQTLRLVVNPTYGGRRVRVRLSNRFGSAPVTFTAASIARRARGAELLPKTLRRLRFARQRSVTIPPGGEVVSDGAYLPYHVFQDLVVSLHVTGTPGGVTEHPIALQTSYLAASGSGDHTRDLDGTAFTQTIATWPFLTDVEIQKFGRPGAIVTVGDSITDGLASPKDLNRRYPDFLARRLGGIGLRLAVQAEGITGNRILQDGLAPPFGPKLLDRLDRDVVDQAGARAVIVMEGTNDLGMTPPATAAAVIAGLETVVERLRAAGLRVILGTIPPAENVAFEQYGTPEAIAARNTINDWIRTQPAADGVVDFHAALADPADPDRLLPAFDSGDHLHPNEHGYAAMADAVDLSLFDHLPCR